MNEPQSYPTSYPGAVSYPSLPTSYIREYVNEVAQPEPVVSAGEDIQKTNSSMLTVGLVIVVASLVGASIYLAYLRTNKK